MADFNVERINAWRTDHLPIYEPGLLEVLQPARDGVTGHRDPNLFFSTDVREAIAKADLIFLCVPTPTKASGIGAGSAADMVYVEAAARMIGEAAEDDKIVVEKSTVPCRTAENIRKTLAVIGKPGVHFDILSNPEFLAEGTAISDLLEPDRVLIGSLKTARGLQAANALADVYGRWIPQSRIITMNLWSSEMAKLSANALLAQRISSINALSAVCEATGADIEEVSYACGLDNRIGSRMLKSSVGFGGSCFKKDVLSLVYIAETHNLPEVATYWKGVIDINEYQKDRFIKRIVECLFSTLTNKKVAILGYAYKKNTGDTRESAAIGIVNHLLTENAEVSIYDPKVEAEQIWQSLKSSNDEKGYVLAKRRVSICNTSYQACTNADAVVIATEWDEFSNKTANTPIHFSHGASHTPPTASEDSIASSPTTPSTDTSHESSAIDITSELATLILDSTEMKCNEKKMDWSRVAKIMKRPMYVFDGRNIVDADKLARLGFWVEGIGKPGTGGRAM